MDKMPKISRTKSKKKLYYKPYAKLKKKIKNKKIHLSLLKSNIWELFSQTSKGIPRKTHLFHVSKNCIFHGLCTRALIFLG